MKMIFFYFFFNLFFEKGFIVLYNKFKLQNQTLDSDETVKP